MMKTPADKIVGKVQLGSQGPVGDSESYTRKASLTREAPFSLPSEGSHQIQTSTDPARK